MNIPTQTISRFEDLIKIGTTLGKNWFRGHSKIYENLTPRIFRMNKNFLISEIFGMESFQEVELKTIENFKRYAPSININLPNQNDTLGWLFLMQHYGFSTRLLDWSESVLVAAFFAVTEDKKDDAEIYSLYPWELNKGYGTGLPLPKSNILRFLAEESLHSNPHNLAKELGLDKIPRYPMAFLPPLSLPRMTAQLSAFTIHPQPLRNNSIERQLINKKHLCRYIIPAGLKNIFESNLSYLGISFRTMFPDIEGLSQAFRREERYYGWSQPNPPFFDKE